jgi:hypothetical protein
MFKYTLAARKEIEEGSSESMRDIMRRLSCQSLNDPKFRKKYGHMYDLEAVDEEIKKSNSL